MQKGDKKIINAWVFYDWANSVYNLVVSAAIFPLFYEGVTSKMNTARIVQNGDSEQVLVPFFGFEISNSVLMSFTLSFSFLVVAFLSPVLSGVADYSGNKKRFMQFFCYLGSFACFSLFFFAKMPLELGMFFVFLASIGFWNSLVFYNAFLPEIAEPKDHDKISARGFSMGYFGSVILLVACLVMIKQLGKEYTNYSFAMVAIWWIGFAQITFKRLPNNVYARKNKREKVFSKGFQELKKVLGEFRKTKRLKKYLISFFFFNTGVQTVMLTAVLFAKKEINWPDPEDDSGLIIAILLIQILGAAGAFIMSRLSGKIGNVKTLMITVFFWVVMCVIAYLITEPMEFYLLAAGVGLVMGGVQSIARSTYSKFLPETQDHASYFSFYDVTEKIGIVLGTFFFGFMELVTGDLRTSVLSILAFFIIGLLLLFAVPKHESATA